MTFPLQDRLTLTLNRKILTWAVPGQRKRVFRLKPGKFTVGRLSTNDVVVDQESVSRRHAQLSVENDELFVEDLASTRGTWIGETRLRPYTSTHVPNRESIWIGQVELKYERAQVHLAPILLVVVLAGSLLLVAGFFALIINVRLPQKASAFSCPATSFLISLPGAGKTAAATGGPTSPPRTPSGNETATPVGGVPTQAAPSSNPAQFLDLPFSYNGTGQCGPGTDEQFLNSIQRYWNGGWIYSFFDHERPIYGLENAHDAAVMLIFTGQATQDNYSGHDGYDFTTNGIDKHTTRVCSPAAGIISQVSTIESIGNYVMLTHHIDGVGDFETLYGHLYDDDYFQNTKSMVGQRVDAYVPIATMDNTGKNTTGPHLHFRVSFYENGRWQVVDPFGYFPSAENPTDPWGGEDNYLWIHNYPTTQMTFPTTGEVKPDNQGGKGGEDLTLPQLCSPPKAVPSGGKLFFALSLSPAPAKGLVGVAKALTFSLQDAQGKTLPQFLQPVQFMIPYSQLDLQNIKPSSLGIRRLNEDKSQWEYVTTNIDTSGDVASATVTQPGQYALFGEQILDTVPPNTIITAQGLQAPNGYWCDAVSVTISGQDDRSSLAEIRYSFRDDWITQAYTGPVTRTLQPEGKPAAVPQPANGVASDYPTGNGRYLVQAFTKDTAGNIAVMPSQLYVVIDPTIDPSQCAQKTLTVGNSK